MNKGVEDYLEAIYNSLQKRGHARTNEIADDLGVKAPSVTEMFNKLQARDLVNYRRYKGVTLTERGEEIGKEVSDTHEGICKFLKLLQVSPEQADRDACRIEHNLSGETIEQLNKFVCFVEERSEDDPAWLERFQLFSREVGLPN